MKQIIVLVLAFAAVFSTTVSAQDNQRIPSKGMAVYEAKGKFTPYEFTRHPVGDNDVLIEILYSGICHSDVHRVQEHYGKEEYPMVAGHEIAGRVIKTGKNVTKFKVGDLAGVGCMVNSCGHCEYCQKGMEQFCKEVVFDFGGHDHFHSNELTQGGFSDNMVVSEKFAIKIPANADLKRVAPLFCAGITVYSPIQYSKVKSGDVVAVAGFGGLGHMAVQYLVKLGAKVTVFDITDEKKDDALRMGAVRYVNVNNPQQLEGLQSQFSFIISTIPMKYDPMLYVSMLKMDGEMAVVGLPANENAPIFNGNALVFMSNRKIYGSLIGGIAQTQEMLDYSVANNIYPQVEIIPTSKMDEAIKSVEAGEVKFRYVLDMKTMK